MGISSGWSSEPSSSALSPWSLHAHKRALLMTATLNCCTAGLPMYSDSNADALAHQQLFVQPAQREVRTPRCLRARFGLCCCLAPSLVQHCGSMGCRVAAMRTRPTLTFARTVTADALPIGPRTGANATRVPSFLPARAQQEQLSM